MCFYFSRFDIIFGLKDLEIAHSYTFEMIQSQSLCIEILTWTEQKFVRMQQFSLGPCNKCLMWTDELSLISMSNKIVVCIFIWVGAKISKAYVSKSNMKIKFTPIFEWHMVRWGS